MMRKLGLTVLVVVGLLAALALSPIGRMVFGIYRAERHIKLRVAQLSLPQNYTTAATELARLCQSDAALRPDDPFRPAWTPAVILQFDPTWVQLDADSARVEFGGGFHHYGYTLQRDKATSTSQRNDWALTLYDEAAAGQVLYRFSLPPDDRVDRASHIDRALAEFRRRAAKWGGPRDVAARLLLLVKLGEIEWARSSIVEFAQAYPTDWLDQVLQLAIASSGDREVVGARLERWAGQMGGFTAWSFAAYAYHTVDDAEGMERCARRALSAGPPDDPSWVHLHARHRLLPLCVELYRSGHFATCKAMCEALLKYQGAGVRMSAEFARLRDLAGGATEHPDSAEAAPVLDQYSFKPLDGIPLARLKSAQ